MDPTTAELLQRVAHLEALVQRLAVHTGLASPGSPYPAPLAGQPAGGVPAEVVELARRGNKIEAIKRLREHSGLGLAEAKDVVERL